MISEHEVQEFQKILGLKTTEPIPENIVNAYEAYDYAVSVCSAGTITAKEMILICMMNGHCHNRDSKKDEKLATTRYFDGEKVTVKFQNETKGGVFMRYLKGDDTGKAHVKVDCDHAKYREIPLIDITSVEG